MILLINTLGSRSQARHTIMKAFSVAAFLLVLSPLLVAGGHVDLSIGKYPFSRVLYNAEGQYYGLHWNFDIAAKTIRFAVNVSTVGWVGFGVSPTGQMPGSDVVIGWVADNGNTYFHVSLSQAGRHVMSACAIIICLLIRMK